MCFLKLENQELRKERLPPHSGERDDGVELGPVIVQLHSVLECRCTCCSDLSRDLGRHAVKLGLSLQLGRRTPPYLSPGRLTAKPLPAGRAGCPVPAQTRPRALHAFQKQVSVRAPGSAPLCWLAPLQGVLCVASDPGNVFSGPEYLGNIHCMELRPG